MTRSGFGVVILLVPLVLVGALWSLNVRQSGPTSQQSMQADKQAQQISAAANFGQAAIQLEAFHAEHGTYVGAALPPSYRVTLVRTNASSYCLQSLVATAWQHLAGPGGTPAAGSC